MKKDAAKDEGNQCGIIVLVNVTAVALGVVVVLAYFYTAESRLLYSLVKKDAAKDAGGQGGIILLVCFAAVALGVIAVLAQFYIARRSCSINS